MAKASHKTHLVVLTLAIALFSVASLRLGAFIPLAAIFHPAGRVSISFVSPVAESTCLSGGRGSLIIWDVLGDAASVDRLTITVFDHDQPVPQLGGAIAGQWRSFLLKFPVGKEHPLPQATVEVTAWSGNHRLASARSRSFRLEGECR